MTQATDLRDLLTLALTPYLRLMTSDGELYWPYVAGFIVPAAMVWRASTPAGSGDAQNLLKFAFPPALYKSPSALLDLRYFAVNVFLYTVFVAPLLLTSTTVGHVVVTVLVRQLGIPTWPISSGRWAGVAASAFLAIAADFGFFLSHYLHHRIPLLWAFHKVHHSAEVLHPLTAFRSHPVNLAVDFTFVTLFSGVSSGVLAYVFDANLAPATLLGVNLFNFTFFAVGSQLRHSHIWLDYGPRVSRFLVSPAMHQVHHSSASMHFGQNLGGALAIWDWLFGTLYIPQKRETLELGLGRDEVSSYMTVRDLYFSPLLEVFSITIS